MHKVKGHSGNKWNDQADRLAKEGINKSACLNVPEVIDSNLLVVPRWRGLTIESPLRSFINIVSATTYETEWANLSKVAEVISHNQISNSDKDLNWKFMWNSLKEMQGKKCISLKRSKALIFCIKCINKILPTKDICYLRNPKLYKSQRCIACFREDETFYHLADCEIYEKIWRNLEKEAIQLTGSEALKKLNLRLN